MNTSTTSSAPSFVLPIRLIHTINSKLCTVNGAVLNLLLVWLVVKRTPRELKVYSKIILQTCICDLILIALSELVQWIPFIQNGFGTVLENGLANEFPYPLNVFAYHMWLFMSYTGIAGICVQFVYRYQILCRMREYGLRQYFCLLLTAALIQLGILGTFYWSSFPRTELFVTDKQVLQILNESLTIGNVSNWGMRTVVKGDVNDFGWLLWCFLDSMNIVVCYAIIVFCAVKMAKFVRDNLKNPCNKRTAEINRQMSTNMIIQSLLPLINMCVYGTLIYAAYTPQRYWLICLTMLFGPLINWVPVLNPLVTICTVAPYRRTMFGIIKNSVAPASSTGNNNEVVAIGTGTGGH